MKQTMKMTAAMLFVSVAMSGAAVAADGKMGKSADGLTCAYNVPANASPAARCAAIKRQCGGKFTASACSGKMLSAG